MRVFFVVALASTAFNCKCEDSVRKALDEKRPEPPSVPEVVSKATAENEPNDAPEKATKIELGHELRPLHAELSSPSDIDWFSLSSTVSESEIIELRVSPDKVETNLSLHVQSGADSAPPLTYDVGASTQYGNAFSVSAINQDGYTTGRLIGVETNAEGVVQARFTNGRSVPASRRT